MIAAAFLRLEIARWLVPDDAVERERCLFGQFRLHIRDTFSRDGRVQGIRDNGALVAAAVWTTHPSDAPPARHSAALRSITGPHHRRFRALEDAVAAAAPQIAHHSLTLLAAAHPGHGVGTRLLRHYLDWADRRPGARPMLHLVAVPGATRLYQRHGFVGGQPVEIRGSGGLSVHPMIRQPPARRPRRPEVAKLPEGEK